MAASITQRPPAPSNGDQIMAAGDADLRYPARTISSDGVTLRQISSTNQTSANFSGIRPRSWQLNADQVQPRASTRSSWVSAGNPVRQSSRGGPINVAAASVGSANEIRDDRIPARRISLSSNPALSHHPLTNNLQNANLKSALHRISPHLPSPSPTHSGGSPVLGQNTSNDASLSPLMIVDNDENPSAIGNTDPNLQAPVPGRPLPSLLPISAQNKHHNHQRQASRDGIWHLQSDQHGISPLATPTDLSGLFSTTPDLVSPMPAPAPFPAPRQRSSAAMAMPQRSQSVQMPGAFVSSDSRPQPQSNKPKSTTSFAFNFDYLLNGLLQFIERQGTLSSFSQADYSRISLVSDAIKCRDTTFLLVHQLCSILDWSTEPLLQEGMDSRHIRGRQLLLTMMVPNESLHPNIVRFFSVFPYSAANKANDPFLRGRVQQAKDCIGGFALVWENMLQRCNQRGYPPLTEEFLNVPNMASRIMQQLVFRSIRRDLLTGVPDGGQTAELDRIFIESQNNLIRLLHAPYLPEDRKKVIQKFNQAITSQYRVVLGRLHSSTSIESLQTATQEFRNELRRASDKSRQHNLLSADQSAETLEKIERQRAHRSRSGQLAPGSGTQAPQIQQLRALAPASTAPASIPPEGVRQSPVISSGWAPPTTAVFDGNPNSIQCNAADMMVNDSIQNYQPSFQNIYTVPTQNPQMLPWSTQAGYRPPSRRTAQATAPNTVITSQSVQTGFIAPAAVPSRPYRKGPVIPESPSDIQTRATGYLSGLHQVQIRSPLLMPADLETEQSPRLHRIVTGIVAETWKIAVARSTNATRSFELTDKDLIDRIETVSPPSRAQPARRFVRCGGKTFRVRCVKITEDERWTLTPDQFISRPLVWPQTLTIRLNHHNFDIRRKGHHGRDLAVDITSHLKKGVNEIAIYYAVKAKNVPAADQKAFYAFGIEILTMTERSEILKISLQNAFPADQTLASIKEHLSPKKSNSEDDFEIVPPSSILLALRDPISQTIMTLPARSRACKHRECFDLNNFIASRRPVESQTGYEQPWSERPSSPETWKCPICNADARPGMLGVDLWVKEIVEEVRRRAKAKAGSGRNVDVRMDADGEVNEVVSDANDDQGLDDLEGVVIGKDGFWWEKLFEMVGTGAAKKESISKVNGMAELQKTLSGPFSVMGPDGRLLSGKALPPNPAGLFDMPIAPQQPSGPVYIDLLDD